MTNSKSTKRALASSILATFMCVAMLVGMTFAWFTDTASTGVNKIQAGKLDVALEMKNPNFGVEGAANADKEWIPAEGETLNFVKAAEHEDEEILWEPGCTYKLPELRVVNNGNLALKYKLVISGIKSDAKLNEAITWTISNSGEKLENGAAEDEYALIGEGSYDTVTIKGEMDKNAGNEYQGLSIDGVSVTVYATQYTYESDSNGNTYDANAQYPAMVSAIKAKYGVDGLRMPAGVVIAKAETSTVGTQPWTITLKDEEAFVYFTQVFDREAALDRCGSATEYKPNADQKEEYDRWWCSDVITLKLGCDIDLHGETVNPYNYGVGICFDGQGHTIKNAKPAATSDSVGFFGNGVQVSNVVLDNIQVSATGCKNAGVVTGYTYKNITNVTVKNCSVIGGKYTGAVVGYTYGDVTNCVVENTAVSGRYKVGGILGYICCQDRGTATSETTTDKRNVSGNKLTGVTVKGDNLVSDKSDFVIGRIVGNWNSLNGTCNNNDFSGTTDATGNIGKTETGCKAQ